MNKLNMQTPDLTDKNIERISALFPNVITEMEDENGHVKKGINFELLKQELSGDIVENGEEYYDFTWVGKKQAILEGNMPIRKTLRPCKEESKNWETTENLYIEGDNLDVLKLLQESYLNSIKMIYIDPPYNTGNDFIYKDNFSMSREEYHEQIGAYDDEDNRLYQNTVSNGRFHSDWCSMIYPRLKLAHNLLSEDGMIFISIDDNEANNLRKICDEVFGEEYHLATFIWHRRQMADSRNQTRASTDHEYVLVYTKPDAILSGKSIDINKYSNPDSDPRGDWFSADLTGLANKEQRPNLHYDVINPKTGIAYPPNPTRGWSCSKETMQRLIEEDRILWPSKPEGRPRQKKFLSGVDSLMTSFSSILDVGFTTEGTRILQDLFQKKLFSYPKPVTLIKTLIEQGTSANGDVILDFFGGSSTTAHAVFEQNKKDGLQRKFILVQLPEHTGDAHFPTICEIGKERIRRAGEQIRKEIEENGQQLKMGEEPKKVPDIGFRVLKVDSTNMKDVYYSADEYDQNMLSALESNIKHDRTDMDLLYQVLLDWGLSLSLKHVTEKIEGVNVHTVDNGALMACFDANVPENVVREMAKRKPLRVVFRDSSFADSPSKINVEEIFKLNAPGTDVRVI